MGHALAASTKQTYASAQSLFFKFCISNTLLADNGTPCPASELTILRFIGSLKDRRASTVRVYLSALRALHLRLGHADPLLNRPRIPMAIRGLRRVQDPQSTREKLPITSLILYSLKLQLDTSTFDGCMLWAACCTAFFGFLRAAEFTVPPSGFDPRRHLSAASVTVSGLPIPSTVTLALRYSKTDQFGRGCSILLARSDSLLCPVMALMSYLRLRGGADGPLFHFASGSPLSRSRLSSQLRKLLSAAGFHGNYSLHSFRVGAATTAASLGFPDHLIKALGRWSSDAYRVYVKLPNVRLQQASVCLATTSSLPICIV